MSKQKKHSNICDIALKRIRKYCGKKTTVITEKEKYKAFFEGEAGIFIIEKLLRDIIERCKLPETIELRKKLGYNHDDIMVREELSIAEKIIKHYRNLIIEVDEGNHEYYDSDDEKEREEMFEKHNFKIFRYNPNDPVFDINKFLGKINPYVKKLREKNAANGVINKIVEDFKKIVAVTKLKELKQYAKNILPNYKK